MNTQHDCFQTHTEHLVTAHTELKLRGKFETKTGHTTPRNCFVYPLEGGAFRAVRYGKGVSEATTWRQSPNGWTVCEFNQKRKKGGDEASRIVEIALERCELFHTNDGVPYAAVMRNGHLEIMPIGDEQFHGLLRLLFTDASGVVAKQDWMKNATQQLKAIALLDRPEKQVHLRVAQGDGCIYLDLGDADRNIVEVTADGWRVVNDAPVMFSRPPSMLPLAMPQSGGSLNELWKFVNIREEDRPLFAGTLVMMYHPNGPYPVMSLVGRQGSAKSTTARKAQSLVDATIIVGNGEISNAEDLMILCRQRWLIGLDNLSSLDQRQSDSLCRLATGGTYTRRKKYTDGDTSIFKAKRPVILTSIADVVTAGDLLDRNVRFELPTIVDRKPESQLDAEFTEARGRILGVLLDGVASALKHQATTKLDRQPRLIDFGIWATAAEAGLGLAPGSVMAAYWSNRRDTSGLVLDNDLARDILERCQDGFKGTALELAHKIQWQTDASDLKEMGKQLRYMAPALEEAGLAISFGRSNGKRTITIEGQQVPASAVDSETI